MLKPFIAKAINRTDLTDKEAEEAMTVIMTGRSHAGANRLISHCAPYERRDYFRNHRLCPCDAQCFGQGQTQYE